MALLCNLGSINPSELARRVADAYLQDLLSPEEKPERREQHAAAVGSTILERYAGTYRNPVTRERLMFTVVNGSLAVSGVRLRPRSETVFAADGAPTTWTFEPETDGRPARVRRQQEGREPEVLDKVKPLTLTPEELSAYAGQFYSEELDAMWTVAVEGGALVVRRRGAGPQRTLPVVPDEFMSGVATVRFARGADGRVTGFALDLGRVRNLQFERR